MIYCTSVQNINPKCVVLYATQKDKILDLGVWTVRPKTRLNFFFCVCSQEFHVEISHNYRIQCFLQPDLFLQFFDTLKYWFEKFQTKGSR